MGWKDEQIDKIQASGRKELECRIDKLEIALGVKNE